MALNSSPTSTTPATARTGREPVRASRRDTARIAGGVLAPIVAEGVLKRRPRAVRLAARLDAEGRAVRILQEVRDRYGDGPLLLPIPGRRLALPFAADDVRAVLAASPEPFALATREKRGALNHFQPHGVLVSHGPERLARRAVNEAVLDTHSPIHRLAPWIVHATVEEADALWDGTGPAVVTYEEFATAFWRAVRRITLGDSARDEAEVTRILDRLRRAANWAYLSPPRPRLRRALHAHLQRYVDRAEPGSLAAEVALQWTLPDAPETDPTGQMPQWLFAFDAAAITTARLLAVLATHPRQATQARRELGDRDLSTAQLLPYLRGAVHETVRLWPTTLVILRETTEPVEVGGFTFPAGTEFVIASNQVNRDPATVPHADAFTPEAWAGGRDAAAPAGAVVPFSDGPGRCPGENLVLLVATTFAGRLLQRASLQVNGDHGLDPTRPLPGTLDPFALRFRLTPR